MSDLEASIAKIQCAELVKLQKLYPKFSFDQEIEDKPDISDFLRLAIQKQSMTVVDPLSLPDAPKMNDDFSNYFVINNLPKTNTDKTPKLVALIE